MTRRAPAPPSLGAGAVAEYRERGWKFTPHGRLDAGVTDGPCARCSTRTNRYGPNGHTLCESCRPGPKPGHN